MYGEATLYPMHLSEGIHLQDHTVSLPRQSRGVAFLRRLYHRLAWQVAYRPVLMTCHLRVTSKLIEQQDYRDPIRTANESHCIVFWDDVDCFIKYTEDGGSSSPFQNVCTCLPNYMASHLYSHRREKFSDNSKFKNKCYHF